MAGRCRPRLSGRVRYRAFLRGGSRGPLAGPTTPYIGAHRDLSTRQGEELDRNRPRRPSPTLGAAHGGRRSPATRLANFRTSPPDAVVACVGSGRRPLRLSWAEVCSPGDLDRTARQRHATANQVRRSASPATKITSVLGDLIKPSIRDRFSASYL